MQTFGSPISFWCLPAARITTVNSRPPRINLRVIELIKTLHRLRSQNHYFAPADRDVRGTARSRRALSNRNCPVRLTNGSGTPVMGTQPDRHPDVERRLNRSCMKISGCNVTGKGLPLVLDPTERHLNNSNKNDEDDRAYQPRCSQNGKIKSVEPPPARKPILLPFREKKPFPEQMPANRPPRLQ